MPPETWTLVLAALMVAAAICSLLALDRAGRAAFTGLMVTVIGGAAFVAWLAPEVAEPGRGQALLVVCAAAIVASIGGGPLTSALFHAIDGAQATEANSLETAGKVLRGGAWIGFFERLSVFSALLAGAPEAVAVVLAVKGVGRYQELHGDPSNAAAERFIIGTFSSILWACAISGLALRIV